MRRPRSWLDAPLAAGTQVELPETVLRHLRQVLRLKPGDEVVLFNGRDGRDWQARLVALDRRRWAAEVLAGSEPEPPPALAFTLALGISRGERMDWTLQKAVELGATAFQPLFTERTQVKLPAERLARRLTHWQGVIRSACEQSGRRRLPTLAEPLPLGRWLESPRPATLLLDPRADRTLPQLQAPDGELAFLIGPEGGLSSREREAARAAGCTGVRLGPRTLRTETAPLAALAAAQVLWGDFR